MEFVFQMSFPKWGLISMVVLLVGGAIYGFYIHDFLQAIDSGNLKITNLDRLIFTKNGEITILIELSFYFWLHFL